MSTTRTICLALTAALAVTACQRDAQAPESAAPEAAPAAPAEPAAPTPPEMPTVATPTAYDCGGTAVQAVFDGQNATLLLDGESIALTTAQAASGARYEGTRADGTAVEFWTKGDTAMLSVAGNSYPECTKAAADDAATAGATNGAWRARGNEPFWMAEVAGNELRWTTPDSPEPVVWAIDSQSSQNGDLAIAATRDGAALALSATKGLCRDTMAGMPFPQTVSVRIDDREFKGCGGEAIDLLAANEWTVSTIAGTAAIERAPTLAFQRDGNANGYAGCNRWMGPAALTGEGLGFARAATTMMACPEEAMAQERAFLDALAKVTRHDFDEAGNLLLKAGDETVIVAAPSPAAAADGAAPQG